MKYPVEGIVAWNTLHAYVLTQPLLPGVCVILHVIEALRARQVSTQREKYNNFKTMHIRSLYPRIRQFPKNRQNYFMEVFHASSL